MKITRQSENVPIPTHAGTWYTIDATSINGKEYFLMEHEKYGDEAACIILDSKGHLVLEDVFNGFDDLKEYLGEPQRLFVDMDGTLAEFKRVDRLESLYEYGYFANLQPMENVVQAIQEIIYSSPEIEVFILSAYLSDSPHALIEKNQWLDQLLPEIDAAHRVFLPCGSDKREFVPGGIRPTDCLLDDYTYNLSGWEPPAKGIKLLNGINHTKGTWQGVCTRWDTPPATLASQIVEIMEGKAPAYHPGYLNTEDESFSMGKQTALRLMDEGYSPYHHQGCLHIFKHATNGDLRFFTIQSRRKGLEMKRISDMADLSRYMDLMPAEIRSGIQTVQQHKALKQAARKPMEY
ncbi:hypothetical protein U6B65_14775 (plasmid) [Oscillospiraceae bacterium MB08-C2-2]|nr:hypothetical protein U6B65_14775 [Oscillospiraceae bacterium MB08-C2-2]